MPKEPAGEQPALDTPTTKAPPADGTALSLRGRIAAARASGYLESVNG